MDVEFELSQELFGHEKAVRCLCALPDGRIATGGVDALVVLWKPAEGSKWEKEKVLEHHNDFVLCLCPSSAAGGGFFSGSKDQRIVKVDAEGSPILEFKGHQGPVSSVAERGTELLSGAWDGTFRVWDSATGQEKLKVNAGTHAVTVACLPTGEVVTGSQDKEIKFWRGAEMIRSIPAHGDIVRRLSVTSTAIASCSNDQSVKLWTLDGLETAHLAGHESFVFDVCFGNDRQTLFSAADDRTLIIWKLDGPSGKMEQSILHANTVWGVVALPNGDAVTACADGIARVWTRDPDRMAEEEVRAAQRAAAQAAAAEANQKSKGAVPLKGVTDVSTMASTPGKKEGEVKMFKDGNCIMAYAWKNGQWDLIGEVCGRPKVSYDGDTYFPAGEYDYVFDVECGDGPGAIRKLPMNEEDNHLIVAEKFCYREQLDKVTYLEQITKWIRQQVASAGGGAPTLENNATSSAAPPPQPVGPAAYAGKHIPAQTMAVFKDGKFEPLEAKLKEISAGFAEGSEHRMDASQLMFLADAVEKLKKSQFSKDFKDSERDLIWKKLGEWPQESLFPVIDLQRLYLIHPESTSLFKGTDKGAKIIAHIIKLFKADPNSALGLCCARFLANLFHCSTNRWAAYDKRKLLLETLLQTIPQLTNKNTKIATASILMNFAVAYKEKTEAVSDGKEDLIKAVAALLPLSADSPDTQIRALLAAGTVVVCRGPPDDALRSIASAALVGPMQGLGSDPNVAECAAELKKILG